jgi:hypothetical protein
MKKIDLEVLKDLICEKDTSTKIKNIIFDFEDVYVVSSNYVPIISATGMLESGYIMTRYRNVMPYDSGDSALILSNNFSVSIDEYELRLKQKERNNKLNILGC